MDALNHAKWIRLTGLGLMTLACLLVLAAALVSQPESKQSLALVAIAAAVSVVAAILNIRAFRERTRAKQETGSSQRERMPAP